MDNKVPLYQLKFRSSLPYIQLTLNSEATSQQAQTTTPSYSFVPFLITSLPRANLIPSRAITIKQRDPTNRRLLQMYASELSVAAKLFGLRISELSSHDIRRDGCRGLQIPQRKLRICSSRTCQNSAKSFTGLILPVCTGAPLSSSHDLC